MNKFFYCFLLSSLCAIAEDSSKILQKAQNYCEKHPDKWEGHYNLGRLYYQNADLENAEKCFSESIQHCAQPEHQESILYNLGNTYFQKAEKAPDDPHRIPLLEKSVQNYEGAAALNKTAEDIQHNLNIAKKWLEKLKKEQNKKKNQEKNNPDKNQQQQNKKNNDPDEDQQKQNDQEQSPQTQNNMKHQEMQNVLQKEQNNERILPVNFSNNSNLPDDKVLKDW